MKGKPLLIGLVVVVLVVAIGAGVYFGLGVGGDDEGDLAGEVQVPINAQDANDVGALHIELGYDPTLLQPSSVDEGDLADNTMMAFKIYDDGWVVISMADSASINGDGSLAVVTFDVVGTDDNASCDLTLQNTKAWDATDIYDIHTESYAGSFNMEDRSYTEPLIVFAP